MRCAKCGRSNIPKSVSDGNDLCFHMVPSHLAELTSKNIKLNSVIMREGQILIHKEVLDRIGCSRKCTTKKYICEDHIFEWIKKYCRFNWRGKTHHQAYWLLVPESEGKKLSNCVHKTLLKGVAWDQALNQLLNDNVNSNVIHHAESLFVDDCDTKIMDLHNKKAKGLEEKLRISKELNMAMAAKVEMLTSKLAQKNTVIQQMAETLIDKQHLHINLSALRLLGLRLQKRNASEMNVSNKRFFHFHVIKKKGI
jgi:hypothetical protein